ncbi:tripeptide aminopeptidase [Nonlabens tegetincola]|uniref:Tripeptide aminopeptidase n=2 Tax=Nonlabens tegetincola TaxID=323273 RepID=A0A090PZL2_9FLAO|nr:tripeptide aminopeptidase [Nonlabens tegetincola]
MKGSVEKTELHYIIRDHDKEHFEARKEMLIKLVSDLNEQYDREAVSIEINDQYYNMREKVEPVMHIVDVAEKAMKELGITPLIKPIRGGTDGSQLSYMGLPCPNIFAGGHNFHGPYEYVPLESIVKATEVIVKIAELVAQPE